MCCIVFAIPIALRKKVLKILVPKEPAKKEEEEKSSKKDYKELIGVVESFYSALGHVKSRWKPLAFLIGREDQIALEIVAHEGLIRFYAVVPDYLQSSFEQQFRSAVLFCADCGEDCNIFRPRGHIATAPIVLTKESIFPIKTYKKMDSDPLNAITNAMSKVEKHEGAAIQIMIEPRRAGGSTAVRRLRARCRKVSRWRRRWAGVG